MIENKDIGVIYNENIEGLFSYALYLGFEKEIIMDAIHDVFCKLSADKSLLRDASNIKFYLFRSLKNRLLDIYKSKNTQTTVYTSDFTDILPFDIDISTEDVIIQEEERQKIKNKIEEMLNSLTPRQREIVYLRYVESYDYNQISALLNISIPSCHKLITKSMKTLRERFGSFVLFFLLIS